MLYSFRTSMHSALCEPREILSLDWVVREALSLEKASSVKVFTPSWIDSMLFSMVISLDATSTAKDWTWRVIESILRYFSFRNWKTPPFMRHTSFPKYFTSRLASSSNFSLVSCLSSSICTVMTRSLLSTSSILLHGTSRAAGKLFPYFWCSCGFGWWCCNLDINILMMLLLV